MIPVDRVLVRFLNLRVIRKLLINTALLWASEIAHDTLEESCPRATARMRRCQGVKNGALLNSGDREPRTTGLDVHAEQRILSKGETAFSDGSHRDVTRRIIMGIRKRCLPAIPIKVVAP